MPARKVVFTKSPSDGIYFQADPNIVLSIPPFNPNIITDNVLSNTATQAPVTPVSTAASGARPSSGKKRNVKRVITDVRRVPKIARHPDGSPVLPMQVGILTLLNMGRVVYDRDAFHNERYIWPVGYTVQRQYPSLKYPEQYTTFTCEIMDGGDVPQFVLTPQDDPENQIIGNSATGAWTTAVKRANLLRNRESSNSASGPDYFGFSHPAVAFLIQNMDGADKCKNYHWQKFEETDVAPVVRQFKPNAILSVQEDRVEESDLPEEEEEEEEE
jgi:hypothetical protein